jgi:hypothetical protein
MSQQREGHQRRRRDTYSRTQQRRRASTSAPSDQADDSHGCTHQHLTQHDRKRLAPAVLHVEVAQGLTE